jgi:hypothetical protein
MSDQFIWKFLFVFGASSKNLDEIAGVLLVSIRVFGK